MKAETDAAVAALTAAGATRVYREGEVPASPTPAYFVVACDSGAPRNYRTGGTATSRVERLSVRCFGATYTEVAWAAEKADAALLHKRLAVTGRSATPCRREITTAPRRDPDGGGLLEALHTYTFTTSPI